MEGFLWQVCYGNPHREPPGGRRVLAEMFVLSDGHSGAKCPAEIASYARPDGYAVSVTHIGKPISPRPPEIRASIRRQRLAARNQAKAPLFADVFTAEDVAAKPDYYVLGVSDRDAAREAAIAEEQEIYERMLREHGRLLVNE
jgi:hypothetical protein